MFWGLIMEPNKRYTQVVEKPFHISQAAMDISTGDNDACQVMVVVEDKNFLVCTLQKNKNIQVPLDLYFKTGDSVSFLTNGKCNVHLTGYLDPEFEDEESEEEASDEEEAPQLVPAKNKRKLDSSNDASANKKSKQDKKASKKPAAADDSDDSDEEEDQLQKFLDGDDVDTDENDESFKANTSTEADDSDEESDDDDEEDDDEDEEENGKEEEEESSDEAETTVDTSKEEKDLDMSKLSKNQRRRLKKKLAQQGKEPLVNGVDKAKKQEAQPKEKKKPEAKKEVAEHAAEDKKEKKSLTGGVAIEDLKVGNGPVAKPGKVVQVYYEGRLKTNNKMFDNCLKGPGFKFRLGSKEVISGWDVGVSGMKVGGKRRIVCPPNMAYGAKGSPPVIPPNSTLVFEVELKKVN